MVNFSFLFLLDNINHPSALVGICGACLERAGCVLTFALLVLFYTIVHIGATAYELYTWDYGGDVSNHSLDSLDWGVDVRGAEVYISATVVTLVIVCAIRVYFAICLFSLYYELKDKEMAKKRDAEFAWIGKNTA